MNAWPAFPVIYEINTWVWLTELAARYDTALTLDTVPEEAWDSIAALGFDAVWLMGVWERSPAGIAIANRNERLCTEFRHTLADFQPSDNVGSPYCVRDYHADAHFGGDRGLAAARAALARRGMRLILDFVPNHVAPDHPWVAEHPEYFIQGEPGDLEREPAAFVRIGDHIFACGKDPYFPAWPDVLQLNAFSPALRAAATATVLDITTRCDAIRCDMAMLMLNDVFGRTWGSRAGAQPAGEYWEELIATTRRAHADFRFLAEAYWDLEWRLQRQGFDYCYDKRLYDRLVHGPAESVRLHLCADWDYQSRLVRFLENHDEPRAAATFNTAREQAAAVLTLSSPGARLLHEGQLDGRRIRVPVFLGRRPQEPPDPPLSAFYTDLLRATGTPVFRDGHWELCERRGWPDNASYLNIVAGCWQHEGARYLIVVNLSDGRSQAQVAVPWGDLGGRPWRLSDDLNQQTFAREGDELGHSGLYVDLPGWGYHFLSLHAA